MSEVRIVVLGKPQPAGSKRAFQHPKTGRVVVMDDARNSRPWKQQVAGEARSQMVGPPLEGALELEITFFVARPKSHFGSGRNSGVVRPSAPPWPVTRPDCTKLVRAAEDALTGVVWADDAQVVDQHAFKRYGWPERCEITVRRVGSGEVADAA